MHWGPKAPERRRRLIVDAALDVLRERGFAGARMADIANRAAHHRRWWPTTSARYRPYSPPR